MATFYTALLLLFSIPLLAFNDESILAQGLIGSHFGVPGEPHGQPQCFDYIVVGGGTAGLTIASRLAEKHENSVAVIEAGGFYETDNGNLSSIPSDGAYFSGTNPNDTNPLIDWGIVTVPQAGLDGRRLHYARGKTLGGSSARNYLVYHRGTIGSFQRWADEVGDDSYTFANLLPFFKKSVTFTPPATTLRLQNATTTYNASAFNADGGPLHVSYPNWANSWSTWVWRGLEAVGIGNATDFSSGTLHGAAFITHTIDPKAEDRSSSETSFLRQSLRTEDNLIVFKSTLAKRILFENTTAVGVKVNTGGLEYNIYAKKEVILSAGTFNTPQLLIISGIGPAEALSHHKIPIISILEGVGRNMIDHVLFGPSYRVNLDTHTRLSHDPAYVARAITSYNSQPPTGPLTNPGGDLYAWEKLPSRLRNTELSTAAREDLSQFPEDWPEIEYLINDVYSGNRSNYVLDTPQDGYNYGTILTALVAPLSRGNVTIASTDTATNPVVNPNWLTHPADILLAIAAFKRSRTILSSLPLSPILLGPEAYPGPAIRTSPEILDAIKKMLSPVYHAACTCKMGRPGDSMAVVDSEARVLGTRGLRVVDASAFALLPPGHPQGLVYALAEKIAAKMLEG